jgi:hypothetical protein
MISRSPADGHETYGRRFSYLKLLPEDGGDILHRSFGTRLYGVILKKKAINSSPFK